MRRCVMFSVVFGAVALLCCSTALAAADGPTFSFKLPHCAYSMSVSTPAIFEGASSNQSIVDAFNQNPALNDIGTVVLALAGPREPSAVLVIAERADAAEAQGTISQDQFDHLKEGVLSRDTSRAVAEINKREIQKGLLYENVEVFRTSSDATTVRLSGKVKGTEAGRDFQLYLGASIGYVHQCITSAVVLARTTSMSEEDFTCCYKTCISNS